MINSVSFCRGEKSAALIALIFAAVAILLGRLVSSVTFGAKVVYKWLFTPKKYFEADGDPVTVTGVQIIGINCLVLLVCFILSIDW